MERIARLPIWIKLLFFPLMLAVAALRPIRHDYGDYVRHWSLIFSGNNPWEELIKGSEIAPNAYGPGYALFSIFWSVHEVLPRVLFTVVWLATALWIYQSSRVERSKSLLFLLFLNPFLIFLIPVYGNFEAVMGTLVAVGVVFAANRPWISSASIGLATSMKFYPLVLMPLSLMERARWRVFAGTVLVLASIFGVAAVLWGSDVVAPIFHAQDRGIKAYSVYRFLMLPFDEHVLIGVSKALLGILLSYSIYLCWRHKAQLVIASSLLLQTLFMCYHVGHAQFQVVVLFLNAWILGRSLDSVELSRFQRACLAYIGFHSVMVIVYANSSIKFDHRIPEWAWLSLVAFVFQLYLWLSTRELLLRSS